MLPDEALVREEPADDRPAVFLSDLIVVIVIFDVGAVVDVVVVRVLRRESALGKQGHCEVKSRLRATLTHYKYVLPSPPLR